MTTKEKVPFKYWERPDFPKHDCDPFNHDSDPDHCLTHCRASEKWLVETLHLSESHREKLAEALKRARDFVGSLRGSQFSGDEVQHAEAFGVVHSADKALELARREP